MSDPDPNADLDASPEAEPAAAPKTVREAPAVVGIEPPILPRVTRDEAGEGWSERPSPDDDDDFYLRERPPHHGG